MGLKALKECAATSSLCTLFLISHTNRILSLRSEVNWNLTGFGFTGMSPVVSEHRKQIDDLKKFKNDFRVSSLSTDWLELKKKIVIFI